VTDEVRQAISAEIGEPVNPLHVLLDIPEAVSFEVNFPVVDGDRIVDYPESDTVFTPHVISDFTSTLRRIRLILGPALASRVRSLTDLLRESIEVSAPVQR
jgi:hypothetical protein